MRIVSLSDPRILDILSNARARASCALSPRDTMRTAFFDRRLGLGLCQQSFQESALRYFSGEIPGRWLECRLA
jgi:hypothetical protein